MTLRIAYMTGEYLEVSPFAFVYREISALRKLGVHVETISVRTTPAENLVSPEQRAEQKETYILFPYPPVRLLTVHARLFFRNPATYISTLLLAVSTRPPGLVAFIKQINYFLEAGLVTTRMEERNLVHLHNHFADSSCTVAMLAAELGSFSFSFTIHGPSIYFHPYKWRLDEKGRRALFVLCISHFCRSQAKIFMPLEAWDHLHIVHCGIDPDVFTPRRHVGAGTELLFTGRLSAVKGLPVLFQALVKVREEHPHARLTLVGDGPDRPWLEDYARELGLGDAVEFAGYQSLEEVRQRLSRTDIFVLPSFAEGVPVVLMEAMAAGLPVIATRIAGVPELVEDGVSGFVVTPGEAGALAERISLLLADGGLRGKMSEAGRAKVEGEFNVHTEAGRIKEILESGLTRDR